MSKKQMGFTLIEIVMVLVLLGILSAIAVPKYFDLRTQAEMRAIDASAAELQSRIMARFAKELLADTDKSSCSAAVTAAIEGDKSEVAKFATEGDGKIGAWTPKSPLTAASGSTLTPGTTDKATLTFTNSDSSVTEQTRTIILPVCSK